VKTRTALLAPIACVLMSAVAFAQSPLPPPSAGAGGLPPHEILTIIRSTGFEPLGRPVRNGQTYVLRAIDPYDMEVRLIVDARTGRIVSANDALSRYAGAGYPPAPGPVYGRIFGLQRLDDGFGPARPPRGVPGAQPHPRASAAVAPLPRPRPYVRDATGSIGSPPAQKNPEPPKNAPAQNAGVTLPPVAPLE